MIEADEEQQENGRLYSKDVLSLIFKYIVVYKKYLFLALFFVLIITAANLSVPYLFKTIIDRYVFKQGRIIYLLKVSTQKAYKLKIIYLSICLDRIMVLHQIANLDPSGCAGSIPARGV